MSGHVVVGVDPGPTPGVVVLEYGAELTLMETHVEQCAGEDLLDVLAGFVRDLDGLDHVAVERFVVGRRSGRSSSAKAGETAREQIGAIGAMFPAEHPRLVLRAAGEVKPWASDVRLHAAGLLVPTKAKRHARDAARHALFAACRDLGVRDPLSRTPTPRST